MKDNNSINILKEIMKDISVTEKLLKENNTQEYRRIHIRILFTSLESVLSIIKDITQELLFSNFDKGGELNIQKASLLDNYSYRIGKTGKIKRVNNIISFKDNTAFTLRSFAEEAGVSINFFGDSGWQSFQEAIKIRNKITHPKIEKDLLISDENMKVLGNAQRWFMDSIYYVFSNTDKFVN